MFTSFLEVEEDLNFLKPKIENFFEIIPQRFGEIHDAI